MLVEGEDSDEFGLLNTSITAQRPTVQHTLMLGLCATYHRPQLLTVGLTHLDGNALSVAGLQSGSL